MSPGLLLGARNRIVAAPAPPSGENHAFFVNAPAISDGWQTVFDFGDWTQVPGLSTDFNGFRTANRSNAWTPLENLSVGTDASQPGGNVTPGFLRTLFPTTYAFNGVAPAVWFYNGSWPSATTELYLAYTFRLASTWADSGGTKHFFFGDTDNNHFCMQRSGSYPNPNAGVDADLGFAVGPQTPTDFNAWSGFSPIQRAVWHKMELRITYGTPGNADGTLRAWANDAAVKWAPYGFNSNVTPGVTDTEDVLTTMRWSNTGQTINMNRLVWEPTYGGANPPADMHIDIGHVTCRVR